MIDCLITSLKKTEIYKKARSVTLPAFLGRTQILPGYAESFLLLNKGDIIIRRSGGKKEIIQILNGQCHIKDDVVTIIL